MASRFRQHLLLIEISISSHEAPLAALVTISLKNNRQLFVECRFLCVSVDSCPECLHDAAYVS